MTRRAGALVWTWAELCCGLVLLGVALWLVAPKAPKPAPALTRQAAPNATAPERTPPLVASYTLEARLDERRHRVAGRGTITFVNRSSTPLDSLWFHLYLNAFKNDRSSFLRSPFSAGRSGRGAREHGYLDVRRLSAAEYPGVDLWQTRARHSPGDPEDETDIEVPLPAPLAPGATLSLELEFDAQLPRIIERTGYEGSFHLVAQWFPKLARLEPDGRFAHFAFHAQAEFYADFGRYDVTLDVPASYVVGASGTRLSDERRGDRRRLRYVAEPVHDFAWTAWDGFVERRADVHGVDVQLLAPSGHSAVLDVTQAALATALPELAQRFGRYPYPTLTVVHPPDTAPAAGGMEYPTLITTGGAWYLPHTGVRAIEAVTIHELAHQWFYGLVASNEARYPFLDEGLTSFAELGVLRKYSGDGSLVSLLGLELSAEALYRSGSALRAGDGAIGAAASTFTSFEELAALVYLRTATLLETLSRVFGPERLERALRAYAHEHRFGHPAPAELLAALGEHVGTDAARVFQLAVFERGRVNYSVRGIDSTRLRAASGYFERGSARTLERNRAETGRYRERVVVYREGTLELPVEVLLIFADGSRRLERWDGRGSSRAFFHEGATRLARVVVDPARRLLLDDDLLDNQVALRPGPLLRLHERLGFFGALALGGVAP